MPSCACMYHLSNRFIGVRWGANPLSWVLKLNLIILIHVYCIFTHPLSLIKWSHTLPPFPIGSVPDHYTDTLIKPSLINSFCWVLTIQIKIKTSFYFSGKIIGGERQAKEREKAKIQFPLFTHAFYCGSDTTTMTLECNGNGEFGDVVQTINISILPF